MICQIRVKGIVQGVGFRPFVWQLGQRFELKGHVLNDSQGVLIELIQAQPEIVQHFVTALTAEKPPLARIDDHTVSYLDSLEDPNLANAQALLQSTSFEIIATQESGMNTAVLPDVATCSDCLSDISDPNNRRYGYAFTNCTNCGPRFSIINNMPYDRKQTSMAEFVMCGDCHDEYQNPADRRFHAQPNACPECGPQLSFSTLIDGELVEQDLTQGQVIQACVDELAQGKIVAIKGIGGVHLVCDPTNHAACDELRLRKNRPQKPFALMGANIQAIEQVTQCSEIAKEWLESVSAPIVLMQRQLQPKVALSDLVAPNQGKLGIMLPSNPLHHLLMLAWQNKEGHGLLVFTSANVSGQPQIYEDEVAQKYLPQLADAYLSHNRKIVRRIEDSVVAILPRLNDFQVLRQARGFSPFTIKLPKGFEACHGIVASGADLKNSFAIVKNGEAIMSQFLGDMADMDIQDSQKQALKDFEQLYQFTPERIVTDKHPGYYVTHRAKELAENWSVECSQIQHHYAHLRSCLIENSYPADGAKVLGVIMDGLGFGEDDTLWGGEFLYGDYQSFERVTYIKPMHLLGGDLANREPWRNLYAILRGSDNLEAILELPVESLQQLKQKPLALLESAVASKVNVPLSSSCGRVFDAMAALCSFSFARQTYEGEAAMCLEGLLTEKALLANAEKAYEFNLEPTTGALQLNPLAVFEQAAQDLANGVSTTDVSCRFHLALANLIAKVVKHLNKQNAFNTVVLSGGVFQNGWLAHLVEDRLAQDYTVLKHRFIPANDQGICIGQIPLDT